MLCSQNHQVPEDANFCPKCGMSVRESGNDAELASSSPESEFGSFLAIPKPFRSADSRRIGQYGRNHEYMARAVAHRVGETLSSAELGALIMARYENFNPGSLLYNDHAEGNFGSCKCAGGEDRIFERIARGYYEIRDLGLSEIEKAPGNDPSTSAFDPDDLSAFTPNGQLFSEWLLDDAIDAIEQNLALPRYTVEVLSGNRNGRYPSIGIKILGQQAWAIGFDKYYDFVLDDSKRPVKSPYCGWRGGNTYSGSGFEGRQQHLLLKKIFHGREWLQPHQWWSTHRNLPFTGDTGNEVLDGYFYRSFVVQTFVGSFLTLLQASQNIEEIDS